MITEKIGLRIKELRTMLGLSQEKLALKAEIDRTYLAGVEQGKRNPSIKSLEKIINALTGTRHSDDSVDVTFLNLKVNILQGIYCLPLYFKPF